MELLSTNRTMNTGDIVSAIAREHSETNRNAISRQVTSLPHTLPDRVVRVGHGVLALASGESPVQIRARRTEPNRRQQNPELARSLREVLVDYQREVEATNLSPLSKETYLLHAEHFVRWLEGDFMPGSRLE